MEMKRLLQLSVIVMLSASALPALASAPAPSFSGYAWTGCYIGATVGYGGADNAFTDPLAAPIEADIGSHVAAGFMGGGQAGCDYQFGSWIIGLQGMGSAFGGSATHLAIGDFYSSRNSWLTTATARVGVTVTPNLMVYGRAGAAWMRDHQTKVDLVTGLLEGTADETRSGWTIGAGGEYLFLPNWSVFAEYGYMDFGTRRTTFVTPDIPPAFFPLDIQQRVHTARVGVNVRFNPTNIGK
jgi:outer membrane immunogenic protein